MTRLLIKVTLVSIIISIFIQLIFGVYRFGYSIGFNEGQSDAVSYYEELMKELAYQTGRLEKEPEIITRTVEVVPAQANTTTSGLIRNVSWGGPELWEAVNKRRKEFGVNPLGSRSELCTIASIRLNELLELGKLDGHEGFTDLEERRPDLKWIFEKYSNVAEFLLAGADTAQEAVSLWENTLGHKQLMTGGEYVWGCIYAQNSFAVAIAAY